MQLSTIYQQSFPILDGIIALFSDAMITEEVKALSWPQELSDKAITSPSMQRWLNSIGVVGKIGKPMQGRVGRAYPVGANHIVKFTTDNKEAQAAAVLKGHDSPHAADVYGVHRIMSYDRDGRRVHLYAIALQRLNTGVGGRMRMAGNAVYQYLDDNDGFIENVDAVVKVVMNKYISKKMRMDDGVIFAVRKVVEALYDVQQRTGVLSQDSHGGNMALKGREPAFFDFGRSSVNYDHPKSASARITALPE